MKSFFANLVVVACALHEGGAFTAPPPPSSRPSRPSPLHIASVGSSGDASTVTAVKPPPQPPTAHEQREMETIRRELIEKYIKLGHSEEYAGREVNYFLEDSERSAQYVEMRRIAMARGDDLGIEDVVQFAGAFLVGMTGSWLLHSLQQIHADGGLAWMS